MKSKNYFLMFNLLSVIFIFELSVINGQNKFENTRADVNKQKYERILGIIFNEEESKETDTLTSATIRFLPSFLPESQITIIRKENSAKLIYSKVNENIYSKFNEILANNNSISDEQLAKMIKVERRSLNLKFVTADKYLDDFHQASVKSLEQINNEKNRGIKNGTVELNLDGAFYQLWSNYSLNEIYISLYDANTNQLNVTGDSALAKVSNKLRLEVEKSFFKK